MIHFSALPTSLAQLLIEFPSTIQHPKVDSSWLETYIKDLKKECKTVGMDKEGRQYLEKALQRTYDLVTPLKRGFHG